ETVAGAADYPDPPGARAAELWHTGLASLSDAAATLPEALDAADPARLESAAQRLSDGSEKLLELVRAAG
ncbi:hypothetical protein, partial [Actinophytocola sp.]|uniref:hypothetical protein n=1 Tax=Actinophytocola sp. TaxID=1872138 RepID=UPI002D805505